MLDGLRGQNAEKFLGIGLGLWGARDRAPGWVRDWTGWVDLPCSMEGRISDLKAQSGRFSQDCQAVFVMGMGGSSLCPLMWSKLARRPSPRLIVLDTTDPETVRQSIEGLDLSRCAFLASSKSGTTTETLSLLDFFLEHSRAPKARFAALSDPGSPLRSRLSEANGFFQFPETPKDVGGRFSALTEFGMVPACIAGIQADEVLASARAMRDRCLQAPTAGANPGLSLGIWLHQQWMAGRDKMTLLLSPGLEPFGAWLEQLIAESLGKADKGVVPVIDDLSDGACPPGADRSYVGIFWKDDAQAEKRWSQVPAGDPRMGPYFISIPEDLGGEVYRWEFATAVAGGLMGIDPFNQPNVEAAKLFSRKVLSEMAQGESLTLPPQLAQDGVITVRGNIPGAQRTRASESIREFLARAEATDYVSVLAYLPETGPVQEGLLALRRNVRGILPNAFTFSYGPRYLHSTGQLHKGGPNSGLFIFLTRKLREAKDRTMIPARENLSFDELQTAQAVGDYLALEERQRRILWVELDSVSPAALDRMTAAFSAALRSL